MTFTHTFLQKLASFDLSKQALIYEDKPASYKDLLESVKEHIKMIENLDKERVLGVVGDYDLSSVSFLLACVELKRIVVPMCDDDEISNKIKEANIYAIFKQKKLKICTRESEPNHDLITTLLKNQKAGLILFSSGSTGKPKAIVHDLDNILQNYIHKRIKPMFILLFLMFDHIGGLNTLFSCLALCACGVAIKERKNVDLLAQNIEKYQISLLPASPSFLNLFLLSNVALRYDLSSLKLITYGTEKMSESLLDRLKATFKKVRFHQTFGTSEVGITQTKSYENFIKLEGVEYKIIEGELYLKSKTQSLGYLNADNSAFSNDGYFATGDLVEVLQKNGEEYLKIIGRNKEIINVGGEKVLPSEVEGVILEMPNVIDCTVFAQTNALTGQSVSVKVVLKEPKEALEFKKELRSFCKDKLANFKIPTKVLIVANLEISSRFKKLRK